MHREHGGVKDDVKERGTMLRERMMTTTVRKQPASECNESPPVNSDPASPGGEAASPGEPASGNDDSVHTNGSHNSVAELRAVIDADQDAAMNRIDTAVSLSVEANMSTDDTISNRTLSTHAHRNIQATICNAFSLSKAAAARANEVAEAAYGKDLAGAEAKVRNGMAMMMPTIPSAHHS